MFFTWKHIKMNTADFPETFVLQGLGSERIRISANRIRGLVKLEVSDGRGDRVESVISNGVVIRETDLVTGRVKDLEPVLSRYHREISSLPDDQLLRLIGGNYGVLTEFLGQSRKIIPVIKKTKNWNVLWKSPFGFFKSFARFLKELFSTPRLSDLIEFIFIAAAGFLIYNMNFNFFHAGVAMAAASLFSGLLDILWKKREPYLIKVLLLFLPGTFLLAQGLMVQ